LQTIAQFNDAFLDHSLTQHSRLFSLGDCEELEANDGDQHYITFRPGMQDWDFHSERKRKERSFFGANIREMYLERGTERRPMDLGFARELLARTTDTVRAVNKDRRTTDVLLPPQLLNAPVADNRHAILQRVADIAATVFGATMVIVGPRP
jgi:hypothetical protein